MAQFHKKLIGKISSSNTTKPWVHGGGETVPCFPGTYNLVKDSGIKQIKSHINACHDTC